VLPLAAGGLKSLRVRTIRPCASDDWFREASPAIRQSGSVAAWQRRDRKPAMPVDRSGATFLVSSGLAALIVSSGGQVADDLTDMAWALRTHVQLRYAAKQLTATGQLADALATPRRRAP
jgi:hypothetical protein